MRHLAIALSAVFATLLSTPASSAHSTRSSQLTFEDRVRAQERIERVYYAHQIGATKPFEVAMPRALLEKKVRTYLKQTVALEKLWSTAVTSESLQRELERMARGTRMPERLHELYAALDQDPQLILECLARPVLVDRLARNFFAFDKRIHAVAREDAEALRRKLQRGEINILAEHPGRTVSEIKRNTGENAPDVPPSLERKEPDPGTHQRLPLEQFDRWKRKLSDKVDQVGNVVEERDAFQLRIVLEREEERVRFVNYKVDKRSWDDWWGEVESRFDERAAASLLPPALPDVTLTMSLPQTSETTGSAPLTGCLPPDTWDNGSLGAVPDGREFHTAVWTGSLMLIWGGWNGSLLSSGGRYDPATDTWTPISTTGAPEARDGHTAIWAGTRMVVWGGLVGIYLTPTNLGGRYDPVSDSWTETSAENAPLQRSGHTAVWTGSLMVIWGGYYEGFLLNWGGRYDPATDTWTPTSTDNAPSPRSRHTAVWTGTRMVVWGGADDSCCTGNTDSGGRYDPVTDIWTPTSTDNAPSARSDHTAVWTGTLMIVWSGYGSDNLDTGGRYDPGSDTWVSTETIGAPAGRSAHSAVWTGSVMVIWGGHDGQDYLNSGGRYDPATNSWQDTSTSNAPSPRQYHSAVWTGSLLVVWGGEEYGTTTRPQHPAGTGGRYDPVSDSWTPTATSDAPSPRGFHTAVWTGSLMLVWGGTLAGVPEDQFHTGSGGRYDPTTDAWTPTSTTGAPSARSDHTAVWTGSLMVIWGGLDPDYLNSGGRYDPGSDTWTPTSNVGAPVARSLHTAVWTGSLMVIWGGSDEQGYLNSGGRYDPGSDTWTPISTAGAPSARSQHTAVWTGSLMVIWGGLGGGYLESGGRYVPATDTWTPISTAGAPSASFGHTAVWTGSLMIIWGGWDITSSIPGGRYDPTTDAWTPISTDGAPMPLTGHTAVWTGSHMVIWGGYDITTSIAGGRYDPTADTWSQTSTIDAPSGRSSHSAVWTGSLMLVWGGDTGNTYLDSGGRYSPGSSSNDDEDEDGFSVCAGDCNDSNPAIHPGASELCDGLDNDCDGATDEGLGAGSVGVTLDQATLWPPNHRMVDIHATVIVCSAACPAPPSVVLSSVTSNEPDDAIGGGDGQTINDIQGVTPGSSDFEFSLRAERDSAGDGRLYQATYVVTDCSGNTAVGYGGVFVPHDKAGETEPLLVDVVALPGGSADSYALEWGSVAQATGYNVVRGRLSSIHTVGLFTVIDDAECLARGLTTTSLSSGLFEEDPGPGEGFFYLAEYVNGLPSGYGTESSFMEMIIRSGDSCH